jgi:Ca2+-binding RTX toxin-like protein
VQAAVGRRILLLVVVALCSLGLVFAVSSPEAQRPLCGGKRATISSNDRVIHGSRGPDVIAAGRGPNRILGAGGNDVICGGHGRDRIEGGRGKDTIDGKKDADLVHGGRGSDEVDGGSGRDNVRGGSGNDAVRGGPGRDDVGGGMGDDTVGGGRGSFDAVAGGIGRDRIDGGPGSHDVASYRSAGGPIKVDLQSGRVSGAENERLTGIEGVTGGVGNAECFGPSLAVRRCDSSSLAISGSAGADNLRVSFRQGRFAVFSGSGGAVQIPNAGRLTSVLVSLGAGDDAIAFDASLPTGVSVTVDGGAGSDWLRGGPAGDTLYAGDDGAPDLLQGGAGDDALFGVNILHPRRSSGAARMLGGSGDDLLIGGQPCEGDRFVGGPGANDSASFARVRNDGVVVQARIGGEAIDPGLAACAPGRIARGTEKIEGSTGPDVLIGAARDDVLLGRGGADELDGRGGQDRCIGGQGADRGRHCEYLRN